MPKTAYFVNGNNVLQMFVFAITIWFLGKAFTKNFYKGHCSDVGWQGDIYHTQFAQVLWIHLL